MSLKLIKTGETYNSLLKSITSYDKPTLSFLMYECQLTAKEIQELYANTDDPNFHFTYKKILSDMHKWKISPVFIHGKSVIGMLEKNIEDYEKTIDTYTKDSKATYRKVDDVFAARKELLETARQANNEELIEFAKSVFTDDLTMNDIIKAQQKDEEIRLSYYKMKQDAINQLMRAREIEVKAINFEDTLTIVFDELTAVDIEAGTNYATRFYTNVKHKMIETIGGDKILSKKELGKEIRVQYVNKGKSVKKFGENKSQVNTEFQKYVQELATKYNVHYMTAQVAHRLRKQKPELTEDALIELAKGLAAKKYKYIDPKTGQKISNPDDVPLCKQIKTDINNEDTIREK